MPFGYEKFNADIIETTDKKRICGYFVLSDRYKISPISIRLRTEELTDEIANHEDWILESVIWDATHTIDTNREGLNTILEKAKNNEFDILLLHHVTLISHSSNKAFDYAVQIQQLGKSFYGIVDEIRSLDDMCSKLHLSIKRRKQYETQGN